MPSSLEKLQKFLRLEAERGYDNRAVVGGLNKILPAWENDARKENISDTILQAVTNRLNQYPELNLQQRASTVRELLEITHEIQPPKQARPRFEKVVEPHRIRDYRNIFLHHALPENHTMPRPGSRTYLTLRV